MAFLNEEGLKVFWNKIKNTFSLKDHTHNYDSVIAAAKLAAHPVGSYYWSQESTNPKDLFGGTWVQVTDTFIYAAGTKAATLTKQGSETVTLTAAQSGMPAHEHNFEQPAWYWGEKGTGLNQFIEATSYTTGKKYARSTYNGSAKDATQPHNNMPPHIVAYCWRRTA